LTIEKDAQLLYSYIANIYGTVVQFALPGTIEGECDLLMNGPGNPLENLASVIKLTFNGCLPSSYSEYVDFMIGVTQPGPGNFSMIKIHRQKSHFYFIKKRKTKFKILAF
jgi:hypothetical protein